MIENTKYYSFEILSDEVRTNNKIKSTKRLDCTLWSGPSDSLKLFRNKKGMLFMYVAEPRDIQMKASARRKPFKNLVMAGKNFTGMFYTDWENRTMCYGNADPKGTMADPHDLYLMVTDDNLKKLEILIIPDGKNHSNILYQMFCDGELDDTLQEHRKNASPYFKY